MMPNEDLNRIQIKNKLKTNIQKYEQQKNREKQKQEKQKLLIKQQMFQRLTNKLKQNINVIVPQNQIKNQKQPQRHQFSYSFGGDKYTQKIQQNFKQNQNLKAKQQQKPNQNQTILQSYNQNTYKLTHNYTNLIKDEENTQHQIKYMEIKIKNPEATDNVYKDVWKQRQSNMKPTNKWTKTSRQQILEKEKEKQKNIQIQTQKAKTVTFFSYNNNSKNQLLNIKKQQGFINEDNINLMPRQQKQQLKKEDKQIQKFKSDRQISPKKSKYLEQQYQIKKKSIKTYVDQDDQINSTYLTKNQQNRKLQNSPYKYSQKQSQTIKLSPKKQNNKSFQKNITQKIINNHIQPNQKAQKKLQFSPNKVEQQKNFIKNQQLPPLQKIYTKHQQNKSQTLVPLQEDDMQTQKSYGTYIKNNDEDDEYIQFLRKKKIEQMQKKRQKRNEQKKKLVQQNLHQLQKQQKYAKIHRNNIKTSYDKNRQFGDNDKNKSITKNRNYQQELQIKDTKYRDTSKQRLKQIEEKNKKQHKQVIKMTQEYEKKVHQQIKQFDQNDQKQSKKRNLSPYQTPKTISTNKTNKTKNNIFQESPSHSRDKSSNNRFTQQPKIQPRQRKNQYPKKNNKKIMLNAISLVCLPGELNRKQRQKLMGIIENSNAQFFIFLFKQYSRQVIKGIYSLQPGQNKIRKIYGDKAPNQIASQQVHEFYRYDSGARQFKIVVGCKSFSYAVHAIYIK